MLKTPQNLIGFYMAPKINPMFHLWWQEMASLCDCTRLWLLGFSPIYVDNDVSSYRTS